MDISDKASVGPLRDSVVRILHHADHVIYRQVGGRLDGRRIGRQIRTLQQDSADVRMLLLKQLVDCFAVADIDLAETEVRVL